MLAHLGSDVERPGDVHSVVDVLRLRLARLAAGHRPVSETVDAMMQELGRVVAALPGIDGSAVALTSDGDLRFVDAVSTPMLALGLAEERHQQGPARDSDRQAASVVVDDVAYDHVRDQWPRWSTACRDDGIGSIVATPLLSTGRCWGVVSAGRRVAAPWDDSDLSTVRSLADVTASSIAQASQRDSAGLQRSGPDPADSARPTPRGRGQAVAGHDALPVLTTRAQRPAAVVAVHVEELYDVLATLGPAAGAVVVAEVSRRLRAAVDDTEVVRRLAGSTFTVVWRGREPRAPGTTEELVRLARHIQSELRRPAAVGEAELFLTASIGVAAASESVTGADLFLAADQALHRARRGHGGAVVTTAYHAPAEPSVVRQPEVSSGTAAGSFTTAAATSPRRELVRRE